MIFPLQMIGVLRITGNYSQIGNFSVNLHFFIFSDVNLHLIQSALPFTSLAISVHSTSVLRGEEADVRIKWLCVKREKEGGKERERHKGEKREGGRTGQEMWRGPATF